MKRILIAMALVIVLNADDVMCKIHKELSEKHIKKMNLYKKYDMKNYYYQELINVRYQLINSLAECQDMDKDQITKVTKMLDELQKIIVKLKPTN